MDTREMGQKVTPIFFAVLFHCQGPFEMDLLAGALFLSCLLPKIGRKLHLYFSNSLPSIFGSVISGNCTKGDWEFGVSVCDVLNILLSRPRSCLNAFGG